MSYAGPFPFPVIAGGTNQTALPKFFATNTTTRTNVTGDGTLYTVQFDSAISNVTNSYNTTTFVFTAPVTGLYLMTTTVSFALLAAGNTTGILSFVRSAGGPIQLVNNNPFANNDATQNTYSGTAVVNLTAADTISVGLIINGTGADIAVNGGSLETTFGGYLLI